MSKLLSRCLVLSTLGLLIFGVQCERVPHVSLCSLVGSMRSCLVAGTPLDTISSKDLNAKELSARRRWTRASSNRKRIRGILSWTCCCAFARDWTIRQPSFKTNKMSTEIPQDSILFFLFFIKYTFVANISCKHSQIGFTALMRNFNIVCFVPAFASCCAYINSDWKRRKERRERSNDRDSSSFRHGNWVGWP